MSGGCAPGHDIIPGFMQVQKDFMTSSLIQESFHATGIHPYNPNIFTKEDFTPSQVFSAMAPTPPSFPPATPSSDPAVPSNANYDSEMDSNNDFHPDSISISDSDADTDRAPTSELPCYCPHSSGRGDPHCRSGNKGMCAPKFLICAPEKLLV